MSVDYEKNPLFRIKAKKMHKRAVVLKLLTVLASVAAGIMLLSVYSEFLGFLGGIAIIIVGIVMAVKVDASYSHQYYQLCINSYDLYKFRKSNKGVVACLMIMIITFIALAILNGII